MGLLHADIFCLRGLWGLLEGGRSDFHSSEHVGDVVTDEMALAHTKVVGLALGRDRELIAEVIAASVSH